MPLLASRSFENLRPARDTPAGLKEWIQQERPITDEERAAAAGARRNSANSKAARPKNNRAHQRGRTLMRRFGRSFLPGILERDRPVEYRRSGFGVLQVRHEVAV